MNAKDALGEDIYGQPLESLDGEDDLLPDEEEPSGSADEPGTPLGEEDDPLTGEGTPPSDPVAAQKYWASAYHKSREKDRARYGKMADEYNQYRQVLSNFYQDDAYALRVLAERFPHLAASLKGNGQGVTPPPATTAVPGVAESLRQSLGEFGFLADKLAPALTQIVEEHVRTRVAPLQQQSTRQAEEARKGETHKLLADMDTRFPGWEDKHGKDMEAIFDFLQSDSLTHPKFGHKYELLYKLVNPDVARIEASRTNLTAARRRSGVSQGGTTSQPNIEDQVRKAESRSSAFRLAAQAATTALRRG